MPPSSVAVPVQVRNRLSTPSSLLSQWSCNISVMAKDASASGEVVSAHDLSYKEKGAAYASPVKVDADHDDGAIRSDNFFTRNGLNLESFKKRNYGEGIIELDRSMKPRHLHMIAIGGSIGAGFFVGSGSALRRGGPGSLLIE